MRQRLAWGESRSTGLAHRSGTFLAFPSPVQREIGNALGLAQFGGKHANAKPWKGEGPGVFEVVDDFDGDTWRAVYTVRFRYVVSYCTRSRKNRRAAAEPPHCIELSRVIDMSRIRIMRTVMARASASKAKARDITRGSGNVFADLGFPDAEERQTKLRLAYALNTILDKQHLAQAAAAARLGLNQPKVSALRNYKLEGFSVERLMTLLNALDQDVEIVIRAKPRSRAAARISVVAG